MKKIYFLFQNVKICFHLFWFNTIWQSALCILRFYICIFTKVFMWSCLYFRKLDREKIFFFGKPVIIFIGQPIIIIINLLNLIFSQMNKRCLWHDVRLLGEKIKKFWKEETYILYCINANELNIWHGKLDLLNYNYASLAICKVWLECKDFVYI